MLAHRFLATRQTLSHLSLAYCTLNQASTAEHPAGKAREQRRGDHLVTPESGLRKEEDAAGAGGLDGPQQVVRQERYVEG